jgi:hypothetical protein
VSNVDTRGRIGRERGRVLDRDWPGGQMDETKMGLGTAVPVMEIADTKRRAGLAQTNHPNLNKRITTPGANLLDPEKTITKLVNTGFPLNAVGLVNSMFAKGSNTSGTSQEGGNPLRGKVDNDVPRGGDSRGEGGVDMLGTSARQIAGARTDRGNSSRQAGLPALAGFG